MACKCLSKTDSYYVVFYRDMPYYHLSEGVHPVGISNRYLGAIHPNVRAYIALDSSEMSEPLFLCSECGDVT